MSNVYLDDSILTGIGNAIRAKSGGSGLITPANMATEISNLSTGGDPVVISNYIYGKGTSATEYTNPLLIDYYDGDPTKIHSIFIFNTKGSSSYPNDAYIYEKGVDNFYPEASVSSIRKSSRITNNITAPVITFRYMRQNYWNGDGPSTIIYGYAIYNGEFYCVSKSGNDWVYTDWAGISSYNTPIFFAQEE